MNILPVQNDSHLFSSISPYIGCEIAAKNSKGNFSVSVFLAESISSCREKLQSWEKNHSQWQKKAVWLVSSAPAQLAQTWCMLLLAERTISLPFIHTEQKKC